MLDKKANERNNQGFATYSFYSIKLGHLVIPEAMNKDTLRKQQQKDQTIFKFI